jgi:Carbohydrate family 9 binding domain-like
MNNLKLLTFAVLGVACVPAQNRAALAPQGIPGEVYYAPFPVSIQLDGKLEDWAGVPSVTVSSGPAPSKTPGEDGPMVFAVAADSSRVYFKAEVTDRTIIAGKWPGKYFLEDSVEFFTNFSGDLNATAFKPGISQINIPAVNIGVPADQVMLGGLGDAKTEVKAVVVKTPSGYALEASVPLPAGLLEHGRVIGFQAHLNGSSDAAKKQEVKLIWSKLDLNDDSAKNPSLFGKLVFFRVGSTEVPKP